MLGTAQEIEYPFVIGTGDFYDSLQAQTAIRAEAGSAIDWLGDYYQKNPIDSFISQIDKNVHSTLKGLNEIFEEIGEWKDEGIIVKVASIENAKEFVKHSIIDLDLPEPHIEIHPDGEIAFTWRKSGIGIMNIAFGSEGTATWAAFLEYDSERSLKGRFKINDRISSHETAIIHAITT